MEKWLFILWLVCYLAHVVLKWHTVNMICRTPKLSDQKAEYVTKMIKPFKAILK